METIFLLIYRFFEKRRVRLFFLILLFTAGAVYLASRIRFEEDITRMISGGSSEGTINQVVEHSKFLDKIIVTISASDTTTRPVVDELITLGDQLADSLHSPVFSPYVKALTYKVADTVVETMFNIVYENLPLFLEDSDYEKLDSLVSPEGIDQAISNDLRNLLSPASFTMKQMIIRDPVGMASMALAKLGTYQNDENYQVINGCIFSRDLQNLMLFITPVYPSKETSKNTEFVKNLDRVTRLIEAAGNDKMKISYFGSAIIAVGNAERLKKDIRLTLTITIILLALIITFSVKKKKLFPFIFLPAVIGGIMALAVLYLVEGKVSVISLSIGTVILAITVDYALHITTHYKHGHDIIGTIKDVSFPIIVCGFATAFEFLTLVFVSSESLHELGIMAAVSVITAAFFTMVVLPHILDTTHEAKDETEEKNYLEVVLDKITQYGFDRNKLLLLFMVIYSIVALFYIGRVGFEDDMMKMNYMSDELIKTEDKLNRINNTKLSSVYVVAYGNDLQQALRKNETVMQQAVELKNKGVVRDFNSPGSMLMSDSLQLYKINKWNNFWQHEKKRNFLTLLEEKAIATGFRPGSFAQFNMLMNREFQVADSSLFNTLESVFFIDNISVTPEMASVITVVKVNNTDKDQAVQSFSGADGIFVIDRKSVLSQIVNTLGEDFNFIANVSLLLILGVLILAFGRIELGIITFVPIFLSWIWTLGFMGMSDIRFNIFNIIISSFITGLGIDYSIYIMQGLVQGFKTDNKNLLSYKTCILISVMISISGTGVLILAKHPALNSIALISIVGLLSVVLISYTFEPIFFNWLVVKNGKSRYLPVIFSDIVLTIIVFAIFILGCVFMNVMLLLVLLLPLASSQKRLIMHKGMMFWCRVPVYAMVHIRKNIVNLSNEDFSKPALIVSNHQSHIDLLLLLMLHPKLIVLTTKWVWNNPIYALVIRYLNYYPVMGGYEELTGRLKAKASEGYSIIVFPEGSRSPDSSIRRFHKGAFLIAHELGLDLLPVFIHGAGECMNKGENHLRGGSVTVKIYPRIRPGDREYGADYHEMTRYMLLFYRREYSKIREELETPAYYRRKVIRNYIYKGPVLEWYTRIKMSLESNYAYIDKLVPRRATVTDIGCGYGYLSYLLNFVSPERKIQGVDYDEDKIELANHCISKNEQMSFIAADATQYEPDNSDIFILSDVLHYLNDNQQTTLVEKCIEKLNPGGKIIIRDADSDLKKQHRRTRYTEFFSTRSGFNKAKDNKLHFFSGSKIRKIAENRGFQITITPSSKLTSNTLFVLQKPPVVQ